MIDFAKMHGTGNDFVVFADVSNEYELTSSVAARLCDRRFGVGADGVIRIGRDETKHFYMDYRNSDGSFSEMCGNGIRVVAKWLGDRGLAGETLDVVTGDGRKKLTLTRGTDGLVSHVKVDMGEPRVPNEVTQTIVVGTQSFVVSKVSMGNPHAVVFVDNIDDVDLDVIGPLLQSDTTHFPDGVNVEVVDVQGESLLRQRTFERGSGETLACGTGACAVAVAARRQSLTGDAVRVELRGGSLDIEWRDGRNVFMTGPAVEVFTGQFDANYFGLLRRA